MAIRPVLIDKLSPFIGESCALCKEPFAPGEEIILCPEDAARHHVYCWSANGNRCAAFGCRGNGAPITRTPIPIDAIEENEAGGEEDPASRVKTLPSSSFSCAQSCLIVAIAISILIFAVSCFGLWAILDYVVVEIFGWRYRQPLSDLLTIMPATLGSIPTIVALRFENP